jgi:hypothetical protein
MSLDKAASVVAEIRKADGRVEAVTADLAAADGAHKLARQVGADGAARDQRRLALTRVQVLPGSGSPGS